jgi:hypothetical protein
MLWMLQSLLAMPLMQLKLLQQLRSFSSWQPHLIPVALCWYRSLPAPQEAAAAATEAVAVVLR